MLTTTARPATLEKMAGQRLAREMIKKIIENPEASPKTLIFYGEFGTGKTTSARILARGLNCQSKTHRPCMKCSSCLEDLEMSPFYAEYDSAVMGNVDKVRELRDTFYSGSSKGWTVRVFDEAHLISQKAQGALLKILEDAPPRTFFVLATTDKDKLLRTIQSRSLEIKFDLIPDKDMRMNLANLCKERGYEVSDEGIELIIKKSKGHMRDAHKYLDQVVMIGENAFQEIFKSCVDSFLKYFKGIAETSDEQVFRAIEEIISFPLAESKDDFKKTVLNLTHSMVGIDEGPSYQRLVELFGSNTLKLVKLCISDWVLDGFGSDMTLQTTLLCIYQMMKSNTTKVQTTASRDRFARR